MYLPAFATPAVFHGHLLVHKYTSAVTEARSPLTNEGRSKASGKLSGISN